MTRRKLVNAGAASALFGVAAAACGIGDQGAGGGIKVTGPATVHFMFFGSGADQLQLTEDISSAFVKANPNIQIERIHVAVYREYYEKAHIFATSGEKLDVVMGANQFMVDLAAKGIYRPLNDLMQRDRFPAQDYAPGALQALQWRGKQYALPELMDTGVIYYNKDAFDRRSVPYPQSGWTWDQQLETARQLTIRQDGETQQWGLWPAQTSPQTMLTWIWTHGGRVFDNEEDPKRSTWNDPKVIDALQARVDLALRHRVAPRSDEIQGDPFLTGKSALWTGGIFNVLRTRQTIKDSFAWDIAMPPRGAAGRVGLAGGQMEGMSATSQAPDAAWKFLSFRTGPHGVRLSTLAQFGMPPLTKVAQDEFPGLPSPPSAAQRRLVLEGLKELRAAPKTAHYTRLDSEVWRPALTGLFTGKQLSVKDACIEIDRLTNAIVGG